jgi:hypothetical protein
LALIANKGVVLLILKKAIIWHLNDAGLENVYILCTATLKIKTQAYQQAYQNILNSQVSFESHWP